MEIRWYRKVVFCGSEVRSGPPADLPDKGMTIICQCVLEFQQQQQYYNYGIFKPQVVKIPGLKTKAKIKYQRWLEVRIFISGNKRFQSQNRMSN